MVGNDDGRAFLNYLKKPLSNDELINIYKDNDVNFELCKIYGDFINGLIIRVINTYLGDDITTTENQIKHFNWCWESIIKDFDVSGVKFIEVEPLYIYFKNFMFDTFYSIDDKNDTNHIKNILISLWEYIFSYCNNKTQSDIDTFLEIYILFRVGVKLNTI